MLQKMDFFKESEGWGKEKKKGEEDLYF